MTMIPEGGLEQHALAADAPAYGFCPKRLSRLYNWVENWVEAGKLPFAAVLLARRGEPVFYHAAGFADIENNIPYDESAIIRIYSMTKPITSVGLMMLYEQARISLDETLDAILPEFSDLQVLVDGAASIDDVRPASAAPTIHQLLTHQSGLTYGFVGDPLSEAYNLHDLDFNAGSGGLAKNVSQLAQLPLLFDPGTAWNYSVSTDVIGRVIEVVSGQPLDVYFRENIFAPLGMEDTQFAVPEEKLCRLTALYGLNDRGGLRLLDEGGSGSIYAGDRVDTFSGGGGLTGTMGDYFKFVQMLRNRGSFGQQRLLGPRTVDYMTRNHLTTDIATLGPTTFSETPTTGVGFGLGVWSMINPARATMLGSPGDFGWGGIASTVFWHDPYEDLSVILFTQLVPSNTYPLRKQLRALIYQALTE